MADRLNLIGPAMEQPQYHLLERKKVRAQHVLRIWLLHCYLLVIFFFCFIRRMMNVLREHGGLARGGGEY